MPGSGAFPWAGCTPPVSPGDRILRPYPLFAGDGATLDTLEDPIEYLHRNQKSIVSQREIAVDTRDYHHALRASLRQAPDVIQLGEMRDLETVRTAMTAAETGHLIFATLHNKGAVNAIDRIIDSFPPDQQNQVRIQLSAVVHTVVSQQLLPDVQGAWCRTLRSCA